MIQVSAEPTMLSAGQPNDLVIRLTNLENGTCTNLVFKIGLPSGVLLLKGLERIEVASLAAGCSATHAICILPKRPGNCAITSSNFSYSDSSGRSTRVSDTRLVLSVAEMAPVAPIPEAEISVSLQTTELPFDEWGTLDGQIRNNGPVDLEWVEVRTSGPFRCDNSSSKAGSIPSGGAFIFSIATRMTEKGSKVPVTLKVSYKDSAGRSGAQELRTMVRVATPPGPPTGDVPAVTAAKTEAVTRILFLSADPSDAARLRLGEEAREIRYELRLGEMRASFELADRTAVRPQDVGRELLAVRPRIVHFSGHGDRKGAICLENEFGQSHPVDSETLAELFELVADQVDCVVLNACYSVRQAKAIARSIKYVIGMNKAVTDEAAISFSVGFYQAVAAGRSIEEAFKYGRVQIRLKGIPEHLIPILIQTGER